MAGELKEGLTEVTTFVRRTIQIHNYEPLTVCGQIRRLVRDDGSSEELNRHVYKEIGKMAVELEEEIMEFLDIED